jgi:hypothetical protein
MLIFSNITNYLIFKTQTPTVFEFAQLLQVPKPKVLSPEV